MSLVEQVGFEPTTSVLRIRLPGKNVKLLPFSKVAATEENQGFYILSHSLPSRIRRVLLFWSRIGHLEIEVTRLRLG